MGLAPLPDVYCSFSLLSGVSGKNGRKGQVDTGVVTSFEAAYADGEKSPMPRTDDAADARLKRFVVIAAAVLATVAGFVNSVFLTSLFHPVSHVTGSLSQFSMDVRTGNLAEMATLSTILLAFFAGAITAGAILGPNPLVTGRRYGVALLAEAVLLGAAPLAGTKLDLITAMVLAAAACGLQNGMFSNYRGMVMRTSHMTGTMTDLGVLIGGAVYRRSPAWKYLLLATTLATFVLGGVLGAHGATMAGIHALWVPALCCAVLGLCYTSFRHGQHVGRQSQHSDHDLTHT